MGRRNDPERSLNHDDIAPLLMWGGTDKEISLACFTDSLNESVTYLVVVHLFWPSGEKFRGVKSNSNEVLWHLTVPAQDVVKLLLNIQLGALHYRDSRLESVV
jgi:hypothetical protein